MTRKERYKYILDYFRKNVGEVSTELMFGSAFQLLCATVLSAQCTDKRINAITPALFSKYPDAKTMATADVEDVFEFVRSVSYPHTKAKHLVEMARMIEEVYGGDIPSDPNKLIKLPGVGRKTANVLQAVWFGKPTLAVDRHVYRVSHRLGLVPDNANTPRKVEDYLMQNIPLNEVSSAHHWILLHGRYICKSLHPMCNKCPFDSICPKNITNSKLSK